MIKTNKCGAVLMFAVGVLTLVFGAWASPVTTDEAATAVGNWLSYKPQLGCRLGSSVALARTCTTTNGASFHVVKLEGGGFVVTSSDTENEPIVAFSESDDLVESKENPLWVMLQRDFSAQVGTARQLHAATASAASAGVSVAAQKWARLLPTASTNGTARLLYAATGVESVSDVRVAPLLKTKWSQKQDSLYSNLGDPCYNYYTPNNYPCGCVATATAQVMRYHKYPTASVTPGSYECAVNNYTQTLTMQGGVYDWESMPLIPADGTTEAQRQAIGKLTSDIGISCGMQYSSSASSAGAYMVSRSLPERFSYASAVSVCDENLIQPSIVCRALRSNLDAKLPVIAGLSDGYYGHAVVADGYGYSMSTFYVHFNFGWAGDDDAWYAPPNVAEYNLFETLVFNVYPEGLANGVICSGRVTDGSGSPLANADVAARGVSSATVKTDANGIYAFILTPGSYRIASGNASLTVALEANVGTKVNDDGTYTVSPYAINNLCDVDLTVTGEAPEVVTHTVTFDLGSHGTRTGGGALSQTVEDGAAATAPTVEASEGWAFTGWDKAFNNVTADLTVTALYEDDVIVTDSLTVYEDIDEAKLAAMREGKLIFLVSGATWCPYTVELQQYIADAGSTFTDSYVYLWHDRDEDAFGIAATASIPQFWIFTPSTFSLATKESWDSTALFVLRGCPSTYSYFLSIIKQYADQKPDKANVTTIRFDVNDGWFHSGATTSILDANAYAASGTMEDQEYVIGQDVTLRLNGYTRDGFTFGGWATAPNFAAAYADGDTIRADVLPTDEDGLTLYAVWNAKTVTVTFDYQGWSGASQNKKLKTYACGYRLNNLPIETSTDDVIEGWFTAPASGLQVDTSTWVPTEDTTYYLHWHHKTCTIAYNANGGEGYMSDQSFTLGIGQALSLNQFSREGYTFAGWAKSSDGEVVYSDGQTVLQPTVVDGDTVTLYAIWVQDVVEVVTHTVTFDLGSHGTRTGGGALSQTVEDGAAATAPTVEASDGWTFKGWDKAFDNVTADLTVTAQYEAIVVPSVSVEVTGENSAGNYSSAITMSGRYQLTSAGLPDWVESLSLDVGNSHQSLDASVSYKLNLPFSGTGTIAFKMKENTGAERSATWTIPGVDGTDDIVISISQKGGTVLPVVTHTVTFDLGSHGTRTGGGALSQTVEDGAAATAPTVEASDGWTFKGWDKAFDNVTADLTVTAQWQETSEKPDPDPSAPSWTPVTQPDTIVGYFVVSNVETKTFLETEGCKLAVFAANGECRGVASVIEGPGGRLFPLSIGIASSTEKGLTLKCWDAATQTLFDVNEYTIDASVVGEQIGRLLAPVAVTVGIVPMVTHTVTFNLGEHGTRTGGGALSQTVEDGAAAIAPTVEASEGWTFTGWDKAFDNVTADLTVTAQYVEIPVDDPDEPDEPEEPDAYPAGEACEIAAPETTLTGTVKWSAKNLPKGLKINAKTGVISGTPTVPGTYVVQMIAKSGTVSETFDVSVVVGNYVDETLPLEDSYVAHVGVQTIIELGGDFTGCTAKGLPAGLKFAAKDLTDKTFGEISAGTIYGVPSKAVTNCVIFTKKDGSITHTASAMLKVAAAPAWSVGTFNGFLDDHSGLVTLTVAANGKVSGKVVAGGKTWSFSANGYEKGDDTEGETLSIAATAKSGKASADVTVAVTADGVTGSIFGDDIDAAFELWRNEWKDKGATDKLQEFAGLYTVQLVGEEVGTGYLSLTLDAKKGTCKATGKLPDGTSASATLPLVWNDDAPMAIWQVSPSAYKGGYVGGLMKWTPATNAVIRVSGEEIAWVSFAPAASGEYGTGFERTLTAQGAYYNKLATLTDYYDSLAFSAETPVLYATVKTTDYNEDDKKTTTSERMEIDAVEPSCWSGLSVSLNEKGTAFVVDQGKATKPVQDKETKEWSYDGDNDTALTFAFTKATGIFKGSFTCWYDYTSATDNTKDPAKETLTHTSKKVSYEGVMVLGESLRGFYLWERTGVYEDEKTGKEKTYKYKESKSVVFDAP